MSCNALMVPGTRIRKNHNYGFCCIATASLSQYPGPNHNRIKTLDCQISRAVKSFTVHW
jgi:hypothetical protein